MNPLLLQLLGGPVVGSLDDGSMNMERCWNDEWQEDLSILRKACPFDPSLFHHRSHMDWLEVWGSLTFGTSWCWVDSIIPWLLKHWRRKILARQLNRFQSRYGYSADEKNTYAALTLILRRSCTGTVWFYTSTSNKRAAGPKLYTKSLTRDLKRMYSRFTLVRISINL